MGPVEHRGDAQLFRGFLSTVADLHRCATVVRTLFGPSARLKAQNDGGFGVFEPGSDRRVGSLRFTLDRWWVYAWEEED